MKGLEKESYGKYKDAEGNRIVKGDIVIPNTKNASQHKIPLGTKWKIEDVYGDDVDLIGVGSNNKGKRMSLGSYNIVRVSFESIHKINTMFESLQKEALPASRKGNPGGFHTKPFKQQFSFEWSQELIRNIVQAIDKKYDMPKYYTLVSKPEHVKLELHTEKDLSKGFDSLARDALRQYGLTLKLSSVRKGSLAKFEAVLSIKPYYDPSKSFGESIQKELKKGDEVYYDDGNDGGDVTVLAVRANEVQVTGGPTGYKPKWVYKGFIEESVKKEMLNMRNMYDNIKKANREELIYIAKYVQNELKARNITI